MKEHYIHAVLALIEEQYDEKRILEALQKVLESRGLLRLKKSILRSVLGALMRNEARKTPQVVVAKAGDDKRREAEIERTLASYTTEKHIVGVDASLIGGYLVRVNHVHIDHSHKQKLLALYESCTN